MTSPSRPALPRGLLAAILIAQTTFGLLAMTICLPSMQDWGALFGAEQSAVQLSFSGFVLAYGAMQLLYGPLSDRHGRKRVLLVGLVLAAGASWLGYLANGLPMLVLARVLQGAGAAAGAVIGRAAVQDLFEGSERTRVMAYIGMTLGVCPPLATIVGGQIHVLWGWQGNFLLMAVLATLLLLAAWFGLPARTAAAPAGAQAHWLRALWQAYARLAREPAFLLHVAILALTVSTFYGFLAGAPIVLRSYGIGPGQVGWYIAAVPCAYIVGNFLTTHLAHRLQAQTLMTLGQLSSITGIVLLLVLGLAGLRTPLAFALPLMLLGLGHGLLVPPCMTGTVGIIPALAGAAAAVAGLSQQLMGALGGYAVGWLRHDGPVNLALLLLGFTLAAFLAQGLLHWQGRARRAAA